ncbi:MarR family winged helix-turn-helix transcriptional regulator [Alloscardovia venturai]|uniref:MarR family winged helix-turn-helix transcriptional regulator n=1 Tax=Alloscardovia venturai TaxID=1769421 RepID=A0ABW2Y665_9BIFI
MPARYQGGHLVLKINFLNGRLFNRLLHLDGRAEYSAEQGKILSALWLDSPRTIANISAITGLAKSTLTSMLKRLEDQGHITITSSPDDARVKLVGLTQRGKDQEKIGNAVSKQLAEQFYKGFTDEEKDQLDQLLLRVEANLNEGLNTVGCAPRKGEE